MFSIAVALSAVLLVRVNSNYAATLRVKQLLKQESELTNSLPTSTLELQALRKDRAARQVAVTKTEKYLAEFYDQCREATDIPPLKTDFIVCSNNQATPGTNGIFLTVADGFHVLKLTAEKLPETPKWHEPTNIEFGLAASSSYRILLVGSANDGYAILEIASNAPNFTSIQQTWPGRFKDLVGPAQRYGKQLSSSGIRSTASRESGESNFRLIREPTNEEIFVFSFAGADSISSQRLVLSVERKP